MDNSQLPETRILVLSWTNFLIEIYAGSLSAADCETNALYLFDCSRQHVYDCGVGEGGWDGDCEEIRYYWDSDPQGCLDAYHAARELVRIAEVDHRVMWHNNFIRVIGLVDLNSLLRAAGQPSITTPSVPAMSDGSEKNYCSSNRVRNLVERLGLPYRVV